MVQEQIRKHQNLPTNRLILVSKSGFARSALAAVEKEGGRVGAIRPVVVMKDGEPVVRSLFLDEVGYRPTMCRVHMRVPSGEPVVARPAPVVDVFDLDRRCRGSLFDLVHEFLSLESTRMRFSMDAHDHPERDDLQAFSCAIPLKQLNYFLHQGESDEYHLIEGLEIWGDFSVVQQEIPFALHDLDGRHYGAAEIDVFGRPTVWVGVDNVEAQTSTISFETTDVPPPPGPQPRFTPTHFPELQEAFPPLTIEEANELLRQRRLNEASPEAASGTTQDPPPTTE